MCTITNCTTASIKLNASTAVDFYSALPLEFESPWLLLYTQHRDALHETLLAFPLLYEALSADAKPVREVKARCQFDGTGSFEKMQISITFGTGKLEFIKQTKSTMSGQTIRALWRTASLLGSTASIPKKQRSGHKHALRLDLIEPVSYLVLLHNTTSCSTVYSKASQALD